MFLLCYSKQLYSFKFGKQTPIGAPVRSNFKALERTSRDGVGVCVVEEEKLD